MACMELFEIRGKCVKEAQQLELKIHSGSSVILVPAGPSKSIHHEWKLNLPLKNLDTKDPKIKIEVIAKKAAMLGQDLDYGETDFIALNSSSDATPGKTANAVKKGAPRVELTIWAVGSTEAVAESIRASPDQIAPSLVVLASNHPSLNFLFQSKAVRDATGEVLRKGNSSPIYDALIQCILTCMDASKHFELFSDALANWAELLLILEKSKSEKIQSALTKLYAGILSRSQSGWRDEMVQFVIDHGVLGSIVEADVKAQVLKWITQGIYLCKDLGTCKPLATLADPLASILAAEEEKSESRGDLLAEIIKSCKRLLSDHKGFASNVESSKLKERLIAIAKASDASRANKAALDLCDKVGWLSKDLAKLDTLRAAAREIIQTAEKSDNDGVLALDLDNINSFTEKIGHLFADAEQRNRFTHYNVDNDEPTALQTKTRCVKETAEVVKAVWDDETLMKAFSYCVCHPHAHFYAAQEFARSLKPAYAPLIKWVFNGHVFEILASQIEHLELEQVSNVVKWLFQSIAWEDIKIGFATEEECAKIYDAFESSRLPQRICEKFGETEGFNLAVHEIVESVAFWALEPAYFKFFARMMAIGFIDSLRDHIKTLVNEDQALARCKRNEMFFLCLFDMRGGDLDRLGEGTPEEWLSKMREYFFSQYQAEDLSLFADNSTAIQVFALMLQNYASNKDEELLNAIWQLSVRVVLLINDKQVKYRAPAGILGSIVALYSGGKIGATLSDDEHNLFVDFCFHLYLGDVVIPSFTVFTVKTMLQHAAKRLGDEAYLAKLLQTAKYTYDYSGGLSNAWTQSGVLSRIALDLACSTQNMRTHLPRSWISSVLCLNMNFASYVTTNKKMDFLLSDHFVDNFAALVVAGSTPVAYQQFKAAGGWKIVSEALNSKSSSKSKLAFNVLIARAINEPNNDYSMLEDVGVLTSLASIAFTDEVDNIAQTMSMEFLYTSLMKKDKEDPEFVRKIFTEPALKQRWSVSLPNALKFALGFDDYVYTHDYDMANWTFVYCAAKLIQLACKYGLKSERAPIDQAQFPWLLSSAPRDDQSSLRSADELAELLAFTKPGASWYKGGQVVWTKFDAKEYTDKPAIALEAFAAVLDACKTTGAPIVKHYAKEANECINPIIKEKALACVNA